MSFSRSISLLFLFFITVLSGCAKQTTVVLLPDPDGKVGKVTIATETGFTEINKAREARTIRGRNAAPSPPKILSERTIQKVFGETLAILPKQPDHFLLYFEMDSQKLTTESERTIPAILATITEKKSEDISVVGHTDTAGDRRHNFELSQKRAKAVAQLLVSKGVKNKQIRISSHGENNPLIPTDDNINEPRNRRVEVTIR